MNEEIFRTIVPLPEAPFRIGAAERVLCVGSCFADEMGRRFEEDHFPTLANPFGVMYNPASILHTMERLTTQNHYAKAPLSTGEGLGEALPTREGPGLGILTLGTNHVYVERATGEIVDNCQKRPQQLFEERCLSVDECAQYLQRSIQLLREWNPAMKIIFTVSPIRYRKYGYHESQLSKATLLMAVDKIIHNPSKEEGSLVSLVADKDASNTNQTPLPRGGAEVGLLYFPSYEILLDELRDYRFYASDMLHPSGQAVYYIYRRLQQCLFSPEARQYVSEWRPIGQALAHRPFQADSPDYLAFRQQTLRQAEAFNRRWGVADAFTTD